MAQPTGPRAAFTVGVTAADYAAATRVAFRQSGILWPTRRAAKKAAARDFATHAALFGKATVTLWEDWMELAGDGFVRREPYALFSQMVETPTQFVFLQPDGRFWVLPKRDIPADGGRILTFLRNTFARKYRRTVR